MQVSVSKVNEIVEAAAKTVRGRMEIRHSAGDLSMILSAIDLLVDLVKSRVSEVQVAPSATAGGELDLSGSSLDGDGEG